MSGFEPKLTQIITILGRRCRGHRHRRSQGVLWVQVHPQGGEKNLGRNL